MLLNNGHFSHLNWIISTHFALDIGQDGIIGDVGCLSYVSPSFLGQEWNEELPIILNVQKRKKWQVFDFAAARLEACTVDTASQTLWGHRLLLQAHCGVMQRCRDKGDFVLVHIADTTVSGSAWQWCQWQKMCKIGGGRQSFLFLLFLFFLSLTFQIFCIFWISSKIFEKFLLDLSHPESVLVSSNEELW